MKTADEGKNHNAMEDSDKKDGKKAKNKKYNEPFPPERTPEPPQVMHPIQNGGREGQHASGNDENDRREPSKKRTAKKPEKNA